MTEKVSSATETIYVALMDAGADAWHPVVAVPRAGDLFLILSKNDDPEAEHWQFSSGSLVRCEPRLIGGNEQLVAVELIRPQAPRSIPM
jgi:hypothetical protein